MHQLQTRRVSGGIVRETQRLQAWRSNNGSKPAAASLSMFGVIPAAACQFAPISPCSSSDGVEAASVNACERRDATRDMLRRPLATFANR